MFFIYSTWYHGPGFTKSIFIERCFALTPIVCRESSLSAQSSTLFIVKAKGTYRYWGAQEPGVFGLKSEGTQVIRILFLAGDGNCMHIVNW